jgi:uncharacterized protein (DUF952 family)
MAKTLSFILAFCLVTVAATAQIREIPAPVKDAFAKQYPAAEQSSYDDILTAVHVNFVLNGEKMIAKYTNKGVWKETEKGAAFDSIPADVRDGFWKSKYADWQVKETAIVYMPNGGERYRLKVENGELELNRKYLYFNKNGRLIRDARTL